MNTKSPAYAGIRAAYLERKPSRRLDIHVITRGCSYQRQSHGGCSFCALKTLSTNGKPVSGMDLVSQVEKAIHDSISQNVSFNEIFVHSSGSFMNDLEIPQPAREEIFAIAAGVKQIKRLIVEARPENLLKSEKELKKLKAIAPEMKFEIMLGLETVNDELRADLLNKGFSLSDFEDAAYFLKELGIGVVAGLILKMPGLNESEGVTDVLESLAWLDSFRQKIIGEVRASVSPLYIGKASPLEDLYTEGSCTAPSLWSVAEVIKRSFSIPMELEISLYRPLQPLADTSGGCPQCNKALREAIMRFNTTQDRNLSVVANCNCRNNWLQMLKEESMQR